MTSCLLVNIRLLIFYPSWNMNNTVSTSLDNNWWLHCSICCSVCWLCHCNSANSSRDWTGCRASFTRLRRSLPGRMEQLLTCLQHFYFMQRTELLATCIVTIASLQSIVVGKTAAVFACREAEVHTDHWPAALCSQIHSCGRLLHGQQTHHRGDIWSRSRFYPRSLFFFSPAEVLLAFSAE